MIQQEKITKMLVEYPILKAEVKLLRAKNGGTIFKINQYATAIKEIAEENAKLKHQIYKLEKENEALICKVCMGHSQ